MCRPTSQKRSSSADGSRSSRMRRSGVPTRPRAQGGLEAGSSLFYFSCNTSPVMNQVELISRARIFAETRPRDSCDVTVPGWLAVCKGQPLVLLAEMIAPEEWSTELETRRASAAEIVERHGCDAFLVFGSHGHAEHFRYLTNFAPALGDAWLVQAGSQAPVCVLDFDWQVEEARRR